MVQSKKYYKSCTVGVTSEVGLTTDRDLSELTVLKKYDVFYTSAIPEVTWYEPLHPPPKFLKYVHRTSYFCLLGFISIVPVGVRFCLFVQYCCIGEGLGNSNIS